MNLLLAIALLFPTAHDAGLVPDYGTATWYGAHHSVSKHYCYGGFRNTCSPYAKGEKVYYAAVGSFSFYDEPYKVEVCRQGTTRCVIVVVRDYCLGASKALKDGKPWTRNKRVIDLSPAAFMKLAPLTKGIIYVTVRELP